MNLDFMFLLGGNFLLAGSALGAFLVILLRGDKTLTHKYLAALNFTLFLWSLDNILINFISDYSTALAAARISQIGSICFIPSFLYLAYSIRGYKDSKTFIYATFSLICLCLIFLPTKYFVNGFNIFTSYGLKQVSPGIFFYFFAFVLSFYVIYCLHILINVIKKSKTIYKKNQAIFISVAYGTFAFGGILYFMCIFRIFNWFSPAGYFGLAGIVFLFYSLIWKDFFLTLRHILKSAIMLVLLVCFSLTFLYVNIYIKNIAATVFLFVILLLIYTYTHKVINNFFSDLLLKKYKIIQDQLNEILEKNTATQTKIEGIFNVLSKKVKETVKIKDAFIYSWNDNIRKYEIYSGDAARHPAIDENSLFLIRLYNTKKYLYKEFLYKCDDEQNLIKEMESFNISLCIPVFINNILSYIVCYGKKENGEIYHKEEIKSLEEIIDKCKEQIEAINRFNLLSYNFAKATKQDYQIHLLNGSRELSQIANVDSLLKKTAEFLTRSLRCSFVKIYLYNEKTGCYEFAKSKDTVEKIHESNYLVTLLKQSRAFYKIEDLEEWAEIKTKEDSEAYETFKKSNGVLICPLIDEIFLGFVILGDKVIHEDNRLINKPNHDKHYTKEDAYSLMFILDRAGIALHNIMIKEQLMKDLNLNIFNRSYMEKTLSENVETVLREGGSLSFLMIDGDNFKLFNEASHDFGNKILETIRDIILETIRPADKLCRWGGEEFCIILPTAKLDDSVILGERIRTNLAKNEKMNKLLSEYKKIKDINIKSTLTIGTSSFKSKGKETFQKEDVETIVKTLCSIADVYMLKGKIEGKDRVVRGEEFQKGYMFNEEKVLKERKNLLIVTKNGETITGSVQTNPDITYSSELNTEKLSGFSHLILDEKFYYDVSENLQKAANKLRDSCRGIHLGVFLNGGETKEIFIENGIKCFCAPLSYTDLKNWLK